MKKTKTIGELSFNEPLRRTFEKTAEHLAGKKLFLCFRTPPNPRATGECYKSGDLIHIDIDPNLTAWGAALIALHEIAHARLHWQLMQPMPAAQIKARSSDRENLPTLEQQAEALAAKWFAWAQRTAPGWAENLPDEKKAIAYMTTLLFYKG